MQVIIDVDPEVCRLGYGTLDALKTVCEAAAKPSASRLVTNVYSIHFPKGQRPRQPSDRHPGIRDGQRWLHWRFPGGNTVVKTQAKDSKLDGLARCGVRRG